MKNRGHVLRREERLLKEAIMIFSRWMKMMIAIDGRDRASFHASSLPLDDHPTIDKRSRCFDEEVLQF